jgi:uncharacterized protein YbjT (DUF2867 family)
MERTALVVGATGLVGRQVVAHLLARPEYSGVVALVRRAMGLSNAKLAERIVDFERLADTEMRADDVYACLGTTIKVAGSQERFRRVDHDYTVEVARLAREKGATRLALVSAIAASPNSGNFYLRVKGETERDVAALGYATLTIARPSYLLGERTESRPGEAVGIAAARALSFALVGSLKQYRPIGADVVAEALIRETLAGAPGQRIVTFAEMASS